MHDPVNAPAHYRAGSPHETIKVLEAWLTPEQFEGYLRGNVIKYVSRAGLKGSAAEDLGKARWYLNRLLELPGKARPEPAADSAWANLERLARGGGQ